MNCFYHAATPAVGICKNCNRGLCPPRAAEMENGLACQSRCESAVDVINDVLERHRQAYQKIASAYSGIGWVSLVLGVPLLVVALLSGINGNTSFAVANGVFATFMLSFAYISFRGAKQMRNKE